MYKLQRYYEGVSWSVIIYTCTVSCATSDHTFPSHSEPLVHRRCCNAIQRGPFARLANLTQRHARMVPRTPLMLPVIFTPDFSAFDIDRVPNMDRVFVEDFPLVARRAFTTSVPGRRVVSVDIERLVGFRECAGSSVLEGRDGAA